MQWRKCKVITRDFLMNADCKTAFGAIEESLLWSAEQRAASLAATLACRPDEGPVWIFGYGSLMWNPALEFTESCTGTLVGWHRAFCLRLTAGRGTAHQPGRMLALKEGGRTTGVAYRLPEETLEQELTLLLSLIHISEPTRLGMISYAVFCLKKKKNLKQKKTIGTEKVLGKDKDAATVYNEHLIA